MHTLTQDIKNHSFKPIYLLYGEESFLKNSYKNQMKAAITAGDTMNFNQFEGKGIDVHEVISLADTMPFFCRKTPDPGGKQRFFLKRLLMKWYLIYPRCRIPHA